MRKQPRRPTPLNAEEINTRIVLLEQNFIGPKKLSKKKAQKLLNQIKTLRAWLLRLRSPEEWNRMIYAISNNTVRIKVACIVWWDYFSSRHTEDRWPQLDALVNQGLGNMSFDKSSVAKALIRLGYSTSGATRRANRCRSPASDSGRGEAVPSRYADSLHLIVGRMMKGKTE